MRRRWLLALGITFASLVPVSGASAADNTNDLPQLVKGACEISYDKPRYAVSTTLSFGVACTMLPEFTPLDEGVCATLMVVYYTTALPTTLQATTAALVCPWVEAGLCTDSTCTYLAWQGSFTTPAAAIWLEPSPEFTQLRISDENAVSHTMHVADVNLVNNTPDFPCGDGTGNISNYPDGCFGEAAQEVVFDNSSTTSALEDIDGRVTLGLSLVVFIGSAILVGTLGRGNA